MAFSDLQLKVASETAIMKLQRHMSSIKYFAKDLKPMAGTKYAGIAVPVYSLTEAAEFDATSNNYCNSEGVDGVVVTLDKHFVKSVALTDLQNGEADINFLRDGSAAIAEVLGHATNKYVYGLINATNVSKSASFNGASKQAFADLFKIADDNGVNPYECVLALNATMYSKLLSTLDANVYSTDEAIKWGVIEGLYGFRAVVMTPYLPEGTVGAIIPYNTIGVCSRLNVPAINGYVNLFTGETEDGFGIQFRVFENLCEGKAVLAGDVLVGAKILQDGIVRLV
jgi:hypothetical protein